MMLGPVTKLNERNTTTSKKIDDNIMSNNCDITVIFLVYGQFGANQKLHSGCMVCKTYIFTVFCKFEFWNIFRKLPQNCLNGYNPFLTPRKSYRP